MRQHLADGRLPLERGQLGPGHVTRSRRSRPARLSGPPAPAARSILGRLGQPLAVVLGEVIEPRVQVGEPVLVRRQHLARLDAAQLLQ